MWGGRFAGGPSALMREINASIGFDKRLWREDIQASLAHVAMLEAQGIVSEEDESAIAEGLELVRRELGPSAAVLHTREVHGGLAGVLDRGGRADA